MSGHTEKLLRAERLRALSSVFQNLAVGILLLGVFAPMFKVSAVHDGTGAAVLAGGLALVLAALFLITSQRLLVEAVRWERWTGSSSGSSS